MTTKPTADQRQVYCCKPVEGGLFCWRKLRRGRCSTHGQRRRR